MVYVSQGNYDLNISVANIGSIPHSHVYTYHAIDDFIRYPSPRSRLKTTPTGSDHGYEGVAL